MSAQPPEHSEQGEGDDDHDDASDYQGHPAVHVRRKGAQLGEVHPATLRRRRGRRCDDRRQARQNVRDHLILGEEVLLDLLRLL